jgi:hypothetical protein
LANPKPVLHAFTVSQYHLLYFALLMAKATNLPSLKIAVKKFCGLPVTPNAKCFFTNGLIFGKILHDMLKDKFMNRKKEHDEIGNKDFEVWQSPIIEDIDETSDADLKKPFDPKKIDITVRPLIIDSLIKRMKSVPPRIDLSTEFQRRGNLWKEDAQSRLIESLLVRIPLPAFYFDGSNDDDWKVVDGLQRLTTLKRFIIDKNLKLQDLEFLDKYNDYGFDDLPLFLRGRIEETQITVYIINPGTPQDVKYNIFRRINTGGLILKPQEIRHALNQGIPSDYVKELAELPEFKKATHELLVDHKRMEDRDFVTRFIAFYQGYGKYQPDLDDFLNKAMANLNKLTEEKRQQMKEDFIKAMKAAFNIFDVYAFRKIFTGDKRKAPLNKALFDTWAVNLSQLSEQNLETLIFRKETLINKFSDLIEKDKDFYNSITISTGKINAVKTRFSKIEYLLKECLQ